MKKIIMLSGILSVLFIIGFSTLNMNRKQEKNNIMGNWYMIDEFKNYNEVFISHDKMYWCLEVSYLIAPKTYKLTNDSLFVEIKGKEFFFTGIIDTITSDEFTFLKNGIRAKYHKIETNDFTLSDLFENNAMNKQIFDKKFKTYLKYFTKRLGKVKKKL